MTSRTINMNEVTDRDAQRELLASATLREMTVATDALNEWLRENHWPFVLSVEVKVEELMN